MTMTQPARPSVNPLNPTLYALLEHKFGEVRIANAGAAARVQRFQDPRTKKIVTRANGWGEYYCVCCPFCRETNFKLWINHLYGASCNLKTGRRNDTYLAHCYRNGCMEHEGRLAQLEDLIFGPGGKVRRNMVIRQGTMADLNEALDVPGDIMSLETLPEYHPAIEYLTARGFDTQELSTVFNVGVCRDAATRYRIMNGRIFIPTYFNGKLVAWQGRLARDARSGEIKYYTQGRKSRALYNYDVAAKENAVVLVEGAPSVWRLGRAGVCLFGKTLSYWQENTIATTWAGKPVFVMLDCDAQKELEQAVMQLCQHNLQVVPVILPDARDPADYSRAELHGLLSAAAAAVGVTADLSFLR
jgi:hypothetical protein